MKKVVTLGEIVAEILATEPGPGFIDPTAAAGARAVSRRGPMEGASTEAGLDVFLASAKLASPKLASAEEVPAP